MVVPRLQKDGGIISKISNSFDGAGLGDRTRVKPVRYLSILYIDSTKSNAGKMLTQ